MTTFNLVISRPHDPRVPSKAPRHETWTTRNRVGWWIFFSQGVSSFREDVHLWGRVALKKFHIWKRKSAFFQRNVKIQMLASYLYKFKLRLQRRSLIPGIFTQPIITCHLVIQYSKKRDSRCLSWVPVLITSWITNPARFHNSRWWLNKLSWRHRMFLWFWKYTNMWLIQ